MYENWVAESEYGENGRRNAESLVDLGRNGGMMDPGKPPLSNDNFPDLRKANINI